MKTLQIHVTAKTFVLQHVSIWILYNITFPPFSLSCFTISFPQFQSRANLQFCRPFCVIQFNFRMLSGTLELQKFEKISFYYKNLCVLLI